MKIRNVEAVILVISAMFVCLMVGFFWGQSTARGEITVTVEKNDGQDSSLSEEISVSDSGQTQQSAENTAQQDAAPEASSAQTAAVLTALPGTSTQDGGDVQSQTPQPESSFSEAAQGDGLININTASAQQLEALPGIGEVLAQRIVDYRKEIGRFASYEQIMDVNGIGEATLAKIRDLITLG